MLHLVAAAMQTVPTVKGTGVNWDLVGTLLSGIAAMLGIIGGMIAYVIKGVKSEVKESVGNLGVILNERLETKETVAALTVRVAVLESKAMERHGSDHKVR
jgi:hypothetical protein